MYASQEAGSWYDIPCEIDRSARIAAVIERWGCDGRGLVLSRSWVGGGSMERTRHSAIGVGNSPRPASEGDWVPSLGRRTDRSRLGGLLFVAEDLRDALERNVEQAADVADAKSTDFFDLLGGEPQLFLGDSLVSIKLLAGGLRFV